MAEREGFEPPDRRRSTVFKTAAFDHSATSPKSIVLGYSTFAEYPGAAGPPLYSGLSLPSTPSGISVAQLRCSKSFLLLKTPDSSSASSQSGIEPS